MTAGFFPSTVPTQTSYSITAVENPYILVYKVPLLTYLLVSVPSILTLRYKGNSRKITLYICTNFHPSTLIPVNGGGNPSSTEVPRTDLSESLQNPWNSDLGFGWVSTIRTLLHGKINPKDWQILSLSDVGFLLFFRVVSGDYGEPCSFPYISCINMVTRTLSTQKQKNLIASGSLIPELQTIGFLRSDTAPIGVKNTNPETNSQHGT